MQKKLVKPIKHNAVRPASVVNLAVIAAAVFLKGKNIYIFLVRRYAVNKLMCLMLKYFPFVFPQKRQNGTMYVFKFIWRYPDFLYAIHLQPIRDFQAFITPCVERKLYHGVHKGILFHSVIEEILNY